METAKEGRKYSRKIWANGKREFASLKKMAEQDFIAGANWMREELAQWYDPKEYLPKLHDDVLVKYYLNGKYAYAVANLNENMPEGDFWLISPIDIVLRHSSVIGWRPIHE